MINTVNKGIIKIEQDQYWVQDRQNHVSMHPISFLLYQCWWFLINEWFQKLHVLQPQWGFEVPFLNKVDRIQTTRPFGCVCFTNNDWKTFEICPLSINGQRRICIESCNQKCPWDGGLYVSFALFSRFGEEQVGLLFYLNMLPFCRNGSKVVSVLLRELLPDGRFISTKRKDPTPPTAWGLQGSRFVFFQFCTYWIWDEMLWLRIQW